MIDSKDEGMKMEFVVYNVIYRKGCGGKGDCEDKVRGKAVRVSAGWYLVSCGNLSLGG